MLLADNWLILASLEHYGSRKKDLNPYLLLPFAVLIFTVPQSRISFSISRGAKKNKKNKKKKKEGERAVLTFYETVPVFQINA